MNDKNSKTFDAIKSKVTMNKLILIKPSEKYIDEIRAYRQVFIDDGGHFNGDSGLRKFEDINAWIEQCRLMENKETVSNPNWVEAEQFMLVNEGEDRILGMINFRHYLNDYLVEYAGHIGYGVCPSERRKGYAKAMLSLCLGKCHERGLDKVLITCDEDIVGLSMETTILLGQKIGEKKTDEAGNIIGASIYLFAIISVAVTVLMMFVTPLVASIMQATAEAFNSTVSYIRICSAGIIFIVAYNVLGSIFRGMGNSKMPLVTVAIACILNIFGDLLLVAVFIWVLPVQLLQPFLHRL